MKKLISISFLIINTIVLIAQPAERRQTREEYIQKFKDIAVKEMHHSGVPASITLAQGILESGDGNSPLAVYGKNHFGIKCHSGWTGKTMYLDDDEKNECFRKYNDVYDSYKDHSEFLKTRNRYAFLFELKITDYKGWAKGLKKAGYATNPKYPDLLIGLIEKHKLYEYDNYAKVPPRKANKTKTSDVLIAKSTSRIVKLHNNIKYVLVSEGDNIQDIAKDFNMNTWQILKYNDLNKSDKVTSGEIIYLQPKKNKAKSDTHIVKEGETMRSISQLYGLKLKQLYKKNNIVLGSQPSVGTKLSLRKKVK
ncbi:LysM peptidoglycan-binding domain-containing protein [Vicingus serpentipes]|uniref:Peptidoglycan hydrolase n=1 Tax=Vicingus serpentipes TaxID=1926625 RepID=A0A5C6RU43_9FLAO|nr:glucosaminidase domain-containing protein [Vicingus serpentipes]TXB65180.1 LysM peptidoglycan-binding domain-containing protein [Vicingus serpentipes]